MSVAKKKSDPGFGPSFAVAFLLTAILAPKDDFFWIALVMWTGVGTFLLWLIQLFFVAEVSYKHAPSEDQVFWNIIRNLELKEDGIVYSVKRSKLLGTEDTSGPIDTMDTLARRDKGRRFVLVDQLTNIPFEVTVTQYNRADSNRKKGEYGTKVSSWKPIGSLLSMKSKLNDIYPMKDHGLDLMSFTYSSQMTPHQRAELAEFSRLA